MPSPPTPLGQEAAAQSRGHPFLAAAVLLVLLTVVLIATNAWLAARAYKLEWARVTTTSKNLSRSVARQIDSVFSEIDRSLHTLAYMLDRGDLAHSALADLQPIMVTYLSRTDFLHGIFVYGADGSWLVHTEPDQPPGINNSDRDYFRAHQQSRSDRIRIGAPIVSRSTGEWVIPVSKRLENANGNFAGVILATVKVEKLLKLLNEFDVGEKGAISLSLTSGAIVIRRPFAVEDLGRVVPNNPLTNLVQATRSGSTTLHSPIDGIERLVVFEHLPGHPLFVTVALSKEEILSQWRQVASVQLLCMLLLISMIGFSGWYVFRNMRMRRASDRALIQAHAQLISVHDQLEHIATHDALTGLPNRRAFDARLIEDTNHCCREKQSISLLIFDVDHFKLFNDKYGHPDGDDCLRRVADALSSALRRPRDFLARYGGEEFVAILPNTDAAGALLVASNASLRVQQLGLRNMGSAEGIVTVSCGVAVHSVEHGNLSPGTLVKKADQALYRAKQLGRNRVEIAD